MFSVFIKYFYANHRTTIISFFPFFLIFFVHILSPLNSNLNQISTYVGDDGKLHFVDSEGADTVLNFSNKPLETFITNSYGINTSALIRQDGNTINGSRITGTYLQVVNTNRAVFTALQDCVISYISTQNNSTTNKIVESQEIKAGETVTQLYDGIMILHVISG